MSTVSFPTVSQPTPPKPGFWLALKRDFGIVEKEGVKLFEEVFRVAQQATPAVDIALAASGDAALIGLYNNTVSAVANAEQAAATAGLNKAGAVKAAAVIAAIEPDAQKIERSFGVKVNTAPYVDAAVATLNALGPAAPPAA